MMEGDLLEVSLDETQHLWRILVAAKPTLSDLSYMYSKYNITVSSTLPSSPTKSLIQCFFSPSLKQPGYPNENNLVTPTSKKRKSSDLAHQTNTKKSATKGSAKKLSNGDTTPHTNGESNVLQPQNKNTPNTAKKLLPSKEDSKDESANDEHETDTEDNGDDGSKQPKKKLKRGRKLKVLKDNNEAALKKKKPRKTTKTSKKVANQSMTSDEDEECSAANCSRPPGECLAIETEFLNKTNILLLSSVSRFLKLRGLI